MGLKYYIETFGCQMNLADSEEMSRHLHKRGFRTTDKKEEADLLLLNTCTVRQHAEDRALSYIGRLKNWKMKNPHRLLIVTGCAAERLKKTIQKKFPSIDLVVGAKSIEEFPKLVDELLDSRRSLPRTAIRGGNNSDMKFNWFEESESAFSNGELRSKDEEPFILGENGKTVFVTIMRGCNYSCSYCIVPFVRGREIYRPTSDILSEITEKTKEGKKEVMLLGQTVNSYWFRQMADRRLQIIDFSDLLQEVNKIEGVETIRFMSPHPHYMNEKLIQTIAQCKKVSAKIHLPVQSGSNAILKAMRRNYTREEYVEIASKLRAAKPALELSTDFIVGFPGETEEDFQATLSLVDEVNFHSAFCFKYSARQGTEAACYREDLPLNVKQERLARLLEKVNSIPNHALREFA